MSQPVALNTHRGLAPDELSRKYRRELSAERPDEIDYYDDLDWYERYRDHYDDYWDPERGQTADDYLVLGALEESIGFAFKQPTLGALLRSSLGGIEPGEPAPPSLHEARPSYPSGEIEDALFDHVQRIFSSARLLEFTYSAELQSALLRINRGTHGVEEALLRFKKRPGPIVMALLFTPFWVRPLASWSPPEEGDGAAVTVSLVEHLFQIYPVPRPLLQPWLAGGLPSLKWVCWLVLLGQGGNLHHAARRFRWSIAKRFTAHFIEAPRDLTVQEAAMWAEIARRGGDLVDFQRIRRDPAFAVDPTEDGVSTPEHAIDRDPSPRWEEERHSIDERFRSFWRQTVEWIIKRRDQLTDASAADVLEWAMHQYTESTVNWPVRDPPRPLFSWAGRELQNTHEAALEYLRNRAKPYGELVWAPLGLDWDHREGEGIAWSVRELYSSQALAEESRTMRHCVASYAYRCVQGRTAIFSLCADGARRITIELEPSSRRAVQVRGTSNRAPTQEELLILWRWLAAFPQQPRSP